MAKTIGIRREDKNIWERRVPLAPSHVQVLVQKGIEVIVQPSPIRVFSDGEYVKAGAKLDEDLSACDVIFAVKEVPQELLLKDKIYVFFSHTIKGQDYNMPLLKTLLSKGCTLVDYERIVDSQNRRVIFFGKHAGYAGMIDTLNALGLRMEALGKSSVFSQVKMAHQYENLGGAREHITKLGEQIAKDGLDEPLAPLVVGFTGYGNVSVGAQDICDCLPTETLSPRDLISRSRNTLSNKKVYKVIFREEHMFELERGSRRPFELKDYYCHPELYKSVFHRYLSHLNVLVNCIYWEPKYPRIVTHDHIAELYPDGVQTLSPNLQVIGDITCDIGGSIECTHKSTEPDNPNFVYLPKTGSIVDGVRGHGPVVMAVDNLPCELALESSLHFGDALVSFVEGMLVAGDPKETWACRLPKEVERAIIAHRGELTPDYQYISSFF